MAVEGMKLLSITGMNDDLEKFLAENLINCEIQMEDAKKIYDKGWKLEYYEYDYKIKDALKKCSDLIEKFNIEYTQSNSKEKIHNTIDELDNKLEEIDSKYESLLKCIKDSKKQNEEIILSIEPIKRLTNIDIDPKKFYDCRYLKFRYGNVPNENISEIQTEMENMEFIYFEIEKTEDVTWIMYFTTEEYTGVVDSFFNMQDFERLKIPDEVVGKPSDYIATSYRKIEENNKLIQNSQKEIEKLNDEANVAVISIYTQLKIYEKINNLKKYIVRDQNNKFYIVAWVPNSNINNMINMLNQYPRIDFVVKKEEKGMQAPTKLKNPKLFRPFEEIVKMYGMPNIKELDPTPFIAIVTCLMFGIMFGDVGQGAIILLAGLWMLFKKNKFGAILVDGRNIFYNFWNFIWKCFW